MALRKQPTQAPWGEYAPGYGTMDTDTFLQLPDEEGWVLELYQGRVIRMPGPGGEHGIIQARLIWHLQSYFVTHQLGDISGTSCYVLHLPQQAEAVLCPDISYVLPVRMAGANYRGSYLEITPDLVAEIVSPNDKRADVQAKIAVYLQAGVRLIWMLRPKTKTIEVWRPTQSTKPIVTLQTTDALDGLDVIPGFSCEVGALFP